MMTLKIIQTICICEQLHLFLVMATSFHDLPLEMRLVVYHFLYDGPRAVPIDDVELAPLLVSRLIREDVIDYLRHNITFVFETRDHVERMATLPVPPNRRTRSRRNVRYGRPYISKARFVLDFIIDRGGNDIPFGAEPQAVTIPDREIAPINRRDIMFFLGDINLPGFNLIGTNFSSQINLAAETLATRAAMANVNFDMQLIFMRRNWDWLFKQWDRCGFQEVKDVQLELRNLNLWMMQEAPTVPPYHWRPIVDFLRVLMIAPSSLNTITIFGDMADTIRVVHEHVQNAIPQQLQLNRTEIEVEQRMDQLYKSGKLGIRSSKSPWFIKLADRVRLFYDPVNPM